MTKTHYETYRDILDVLWRNDDILFEEDYREAMALTEAAKRLKDGWGNRIMDILNRAEDNQLDQESLFDVQALTESVVRRYAEKEKKWDDFHKEFPWLD